MTIKQYQNGYLLTDGIYSYRLREVSRDPYPVVITIKMGKELVWTETFDSLQESLEFCFVYNGMKNP